MLIGMYVRPQITGVDGNKTLYSKSYSSLAQKSERATFYYTGESIVLDNSEDARKIIGKLDAKMVFCESSESGISTYYYSEKLRVYKYVNGEKVNLHIHVGKITTVGSPIIYGSY
jgi:hypothetical protein